MSIHTDDEAEAQECPEHERVVRLVGAFGC